MPGAPLSIFKSNICNLNIQVSKIKPSPAGPMCEAETPSFVETYAFSIKATAALRAYSLA